MERLLEQEALLEQQDPKVSRGPRPRGTGPDGPSQASRDQGQSQTCTGSSPLHPGAWEVGRWTFVLSLLCPVTTGMRLRACLCSIAKFIDLT